MPPVTRIEIADHVEHAFAAGAGNPASRAELILAALHSGAREETIRILETLPDRRYTDLRHLWPHLPDIPVEE